MSDVLTTLRETEFADVRVLHLNHAGVAPAPARVVRAVTEAVQASAEDPLAAFMDSYLPAREAARERMANLMGVPAAHLAMIKNTGHGLSIVADALRWEPGDNIVSADCEYPSVVYPYYAQRDRGVETRLIKTRPDGTFTPEDAAALMNNRTRVLTLSWVQFSTGFRADLKAFAEVAHAHGAWFVVDVIQGLGVLPLDLAEAGADAAVTGVHKWLLSPGGMGGLYVTPRMLEQMRLVNMGAAGVENVTDFNPLEFIPKNSVQRYEEGTPNGLGLVGLNAGLSVLEDAGIDTIAARVLALTRLCSDLLTAKGYEARSPLEDARRAGIVMFGHPSHTNEAVLDALTQAGIAAAVRGRSVRLSPHFYNTEEEIARAVDALP